MLEMYRKLEQNGVIGRMMKVDQRGNPIFDPTGEIAGTLVERPFQEFPKIIRRFKRDGTKLETLVQSKSEELRLLAENADDIGDIPLSPLERERDELARVNAEQNKALGTMQAQMAEMMEKMAAMSQKLDQNNAERAALTGEEIGRSGDEPRAAAPSGKGIEALATGSKAK